MASPTRPRYYLLWDVERGAWWRKGTGYTLDITEAKRLTADAAIDIASQPSKPGEGVIVCPEPTGRVVLPPTINPPQLREIVAAIDRQITHGGVPVVIDLLVARAAIAMQMYDIPPVPSPPHGVKP